MKVSERIKKYRIDNHITQQELADILYVSKQAISKWENDKSLPDLTLYPTIANLLNITVDELMGNELKRVEPSKKNRKFIISLLIVSLIIIIFFLVIIINPLQIIEKKKIISQTEQNLGLKLPEVSTYNIVDYNDWLLYNNHMYPQQMYYFVFKDEVIKVDETWIDELSQEMINEIPIGSSEYPYICDWYKLVDLTTNAINEISHENKMHQYVLYCLQINNKRLIAIRFEV